MEFCRYYVVFIWYRRKLSIYDIALKTKTIFNKLSELDHVFEKLNFYRKTDYPPEILTFYKENSITENEFAELLLKKHGYWIKKVMSNSRQDIFNSDYDIIEQFTTMGLPSGVIKYSFNKSDFKSQIRFEFPRDFKREYNWYQSILTTLIEIFEPDYGGLYPVVIQKLEPPKITGGWISYFSEKMKIPDSTFADCVRLPVTENKFMYAIEDQHMIQKNKEQFKKLENLVLRFKELNIQE